MQPRAEARKRERVSLEILALFPLDGHRLFHRVALRENIFPTNVNESDANSSTNASPHPSNISSPVPDYASRFKKVSQRHFARLISPFSSSSQTYPFANILDRP